MGSDAIGVGKGSENFIGKMLRVVDQKKSWRNKEFRRTPRENNSRRSYGHFSLSYSALAWMRIGLS
jgi:hypothetical protein